MPLRIMGHPFISGRPITGGMVLGITAIILIIIITIMVAMATGGIGKR